MRTAGSATVRAVLVAVVVVAFAVAAEAVVAAGADNHACASASRRTVNASMATVAVLHTVNKVVMMVALAVAAATAVAMAVVAVALAVVPPDVLVVVAFASTSVTVETATSAMAADFLMISPAMPVPVIAGLGPRLVSATSSVTVEPATLVMAADSRTRLRSLVKSLPLSATTLVWLKLANMLKLKSTNIWSERYGQFVAPDWRYLL